MYKGRKYLVDWFPTKSTIRGIAHQAESKKPNYVTAQTKHVIWLPLPPLKPIRDKHEIRIMLREYNEWLVKHGYVDVDLVNELYDDELDTFIDNFSLTLV